MNIALIGVGMILGIILFAFRRRKNLTTKAECMDAGIALWRCRILQINDFFIVEQLRPSWIGVGWIWSRFRNCELTTFHFDTLSRAEEHAKRLVEDKLNDINRKKAWKNPKVVKEV